MKKLLSILFLCSAFAANAQIVALKSPDPDEVVIGNMLISKDSENIIVQYNLLLGQKVESCYIVLKASVDGGQTFAPLTSGLKGDIGTVSETGVKKVLVPLDIYAPRFTGKQLAFTLEVEAGVNLSFGGTANCYIVSAYGRYKFKTVRGNSSKSVGSVASAAVLWESFGTSVTPSVGSLIESASYNDGYITFQTADTFKEGNAVIAAKDAAGNILWSWHIWMTDQPQGQEYYNGAGTMMDRNLGATSATPGDVGALGLLYQWGRKDPFLGSSSISRSTVAKSTITWPSAVSTSSSKGTVSYVTAHPTTFVTSSSSNDYDWHYSSRDNTLWTTSDKTKSIYDPCPAGWRVPDGGSNGVWLKALGSSSYFDYKYNSTKEGMNFYGKFGSASTIWYPAAGYRYSSDGSLNLVGGGGLYWSASPGGSYCLYFYNYGDVNPSDDCNRRAYGQSVRCLQVIDEVAEP